MIYAVGTTIQRQEYYSPGRDGGNEDAYRKDSHHPLFAFVNDIRTAANCRNRSSNTSSSNNCINFSEETFAILKNKTVGLFRADSDFCSKQILKFIEDKNIAYVVCAKLYANLQREVYDIQKWIATGEGIWISEIIFKQGGWSKRRRIIVGWY